MLKKNKIFQKKTEKKPQIFVKKTKKFPEKK